MKLVLSGLLLCATLTACQVPDQNVPAFNTPTSVELSAGSTVVTAAGPLTLTAVVRQRAGWGGEDLSGLRVEFHESGARVAVAATPEKVGTGLDRRFEVTLDLGAAQNGTRVYTARTAYDYEGSSIRTSNAVTVQVSIP